MAPPRRLSNGRSPLVNQQSQITKFFNKTTPSSTPPSSNNKNNNNEPNPNPSPSPNPTTPSSVQSKDTKSTTTKTKEKKTETAPLKVVSYGAEAVNKRIRVYWPLDQSWYKGKVNGYDELNGKHKVQYEDGDEEELYLSKEKIEWVEEKVNSFRRLRKVVAEEEDEKGLGEVDDDVNKDGSVDRDSGEGDSSDEDWGKNVEKEVSEDEIDVLDEDDAELEFKTPDTGSKKRKAGIKKMSESSKKNKRVEMLMPLYDGGGNITDKIDKGDCE